MSIPSPRRPAARGVGTATTPPAFAIRRDRVDDGRMSTEGDIPKAAPREQPDPTSAQKSGEASSKDDAEAAAARAKSPADDQPDDPDPF